VSASPLLPNLRGWFVQNLALMVSLLLLPDESALREQLTAQAVSDDAIRQCIRETYARFDEVICPHTATAVHVLGELREAGATGSWAAVATAHPAKFDTVVEPLVGHSVAVPPALAEMLARPAHADPLSANYEDLRRLLETW